jgi:K+-sensing histidine kinase KdpD
LCKGREAIERDAEWYAVHVETPEESLQKVSTPNFRALLDNVNLAGDLAAEFVWLKSEDVVNAIVAFAQERNISKIILGRSRRSKLRASFDARLPRDSSARREVSTLKFSETNPQCRCPSCKTEPRTAKHRDRQKNTLSVLPPVVDNTHSLMASPVAAALISRGEVPQYAACRPLGDQAAVEQLDHSREPQVSKTSAEREPSIRLVSSM